MNYTLTSLLSRFQSPLILGMGGGYDVFAGLPTFSIKDPYTFVKVLAAEFQKDAFNETLGFPANYFPEYHLSNCFRTKREIGLPDYAIQLIDDLKTGGPLGGAKLFRSY